MRCICTEVGTCAVVVQRWAFALFFAPSCFCAIAACANSQYSICTVQQLKRKSVKPKNKEIVSSPPHKRHQKQRLFTQSEGRGRRVVKFRQNPPWLGIHSFAHSLFALLLKIAYVRSVQKSDVRESLLLLLKFEQIARKKRSMRSKNSYFSYVLDSFPSFFMPMSKLLPSLFTHLLIFMERLE